MLLYYRFTLTSELATSLAWADEFLVYCLIRMFRMRAPVLKPSWLRDISMFRNVVNTGAWTPLVDCLVKMSSKKVLTVASVSLLPYKLMCVRLPKGRPFIFPDSELWQLLLRRVELLERYKPCFIILILLARPTEADLPSSSLKHFTRVSMSLAADTLGRLARDKT